MHTLGEEMAKLDAALHKEIRRTFCDYDGERDIEEVVGREHSLDQKLTRVASTLR